MRKAFKIPNLSILISYDVNISRNLVLIKANVSLDQLNQYAGYDLSLFKLNVADFPTTKS